MAPAESRSGGNVEQFGDEVGLSPHVSSTNFPNLPLPAHRHHLIGSQCSSCCVEIARAKPRFDQVFHACVVLFKNVTQEADVADSRSPEANRFSPSGRGAWYAALEVDTALAEMRFHLTRSLREDGSFQASVERSALWASTAGESVDLRALDPRPEYLDPTIGYPAGVALAEEARATDLDGIVYPSARHPAGTCFLALRPHAVQSATQGAVRRMTWSGTPNPIVKRIA
jgi:RES domain-containing protein